MFVIYQWDGWLKIFYRQYILKEEDIDDNIEHRMQWDLYASHYNGETKKYNVKKIVVLIG